MVSVGQTVWVAFDDDAGWAEATVLELGTTEALVRETGSKRADWVALSRVFEILPGS